MKTAMMLLWSGLTVLALAAGLPSYYLAWPSFLSDKPMLVSSTLAGIFIGAVALWGVASVTTLLGLTVGVYFDKRAYWLAKKAFWLTLLLTLVVGGLFFGIDMLAAKPIPV